MLQDLSSYSRECREQTWLQSLERRGQCVWQRHSCYMFPLWSHLEFYMQTWGRGKLELLSHLNRTETTARTKNTILNTYMFIYLICIYLIFIYLICIYPICIYLKISLPKISLLRMYLTVFISLTTCTLTCITYLICI